MKKLFAILCILSLGLPTFAKCCDEQVLGYEHTFPEKECATDQVMITSHRNIICKGTLIKIFFTCKFKSECYNAGDVVDFNTPDAIYTQEGRLLIPANSKFVARITKIEKQKMLNKNARVHLNFECIQFPDGTSVPISAAPYTKDGTLKEGPWMTAGKLLAYTAGVGTLGAGAGVGFAFIPSPSRIPVGLAIGIPVGCTIGLITGLVTPGLKYHAKCGEAIIITLCDNLSLPKLCPQACKNGD